MCVPLVFVQLVVYSGLRALKRSYLSAGPSCKRRQGEKHSTAPMITLLSLVFEQGVLL